MNRRQKTVLLFLLFVIICLGITGFSFITAAVAAGRTAKIFSEKAGGDLIVYAGDNPAGWLNWITTDRLPVPVMQPINNREKVTAFLASLPPVRAYYPASLASACLQLTDKCSRLVRVYGINAADFAGFFSENRLLQGKFPGNPKNRNMKADILISSKLAALQSGECRNVQDTDNTQVLIRNCYTLLDVLPLRITGIVQAEGIAVFLDNRAFNHLYQVYPANNRESTNPPVSAAGYIPADELPVKSLEMPDSFFFHIFAEPDLIGSVDPAADIRYHFLIIRTGEAGRVGDALKKFFSANQLPLAVASWQEYKKFHPERNFLLPVIMLVLLCAGSILFFFYRHKQKTEAKNE